MSNDSLDSYIICATPRTGSTLLCALLESTGVAGLPQSYFRREDEYLWATRWGMVRSSDGGFSFADYLQATINAGQSENGVFAARIMWGTIEEIVDNLGKVFPDLAGFDLELLNRAFGNTRFIYLQRRNVVAQAVSRLRAEQTNVWHIIDGSESVPSTSEPRYDFDQIRAFVQEANEHNTAWRDWFRLAGIKPHWVWYEDLDTDPIGVTLSTLDFLGLKLPPNRQVSASNRRLADRLNTEWIERYSNEVSRRHGHGS